MWLPERQGAVSFGQGMVDLSGFAPESQPLIVRSSEPETIVFPSGEKSMERIQSLWALGFSLSSSSVAVRETGSGQYKQEGGVGLNAHPNPTL